MLVDAEMGMPLDLNPYDGIWDGNDLALNPVLDPTRKYDPVDMALMAPLRSTTTETQKSNSQAAMEVSWMRNSSYITRKNNARRREAADAAER
jgi:RNA polymerase II-associated factor 1